MHNNNNNNHPRELESRRLDLVWWWSGSRKFTSVYLNVTSTLLDSSSWAGQCLNRVLHTMVKKRQKYNYILYDHQNNFSRACLACMFRRGMPYKLQTMAIKHIIIHMQACIHSHTNANHSTNNPHFIHIIQATYYYSVFLPHSFYPAVFTPVSVCKG